MRLRPAGNIVRALRAAIETTLFPLTLGLRARRAAAIRARPAAGILPVRARLLLVPFRAESARLRFSI